MPEITAGLTTEMSYAVVASTNDFGAVDKQHGEDRFFWGMRKPLFEAYKIVEVMRSWGTIVYTVGEIDSVAGQTCYRSLRNLPQPVDCAIISLPPSAALLLVDEVVAAGIRTVWLQYGAGKPVVRDAFQKRGVRVVVSCVLLHWDVNHISGIAKGHHVCFMHGNLERAARICVDSTGTPQRIEATPPELMPFARETYGTRLLLPVWPKPRQ